MTDYESVLGDVSEAEFLSDYWQQQPLLVRNALPDWPNPLSPDELAGLALEEEVESRIVVEKGVTPWELRHGPFGEETFAQLPASGWTLLVQGLDLWVPEIQSLLQYFDFLPRWRLDDVMASYAVPGGSVGPHFDQYDVFLLQVAGQRRWQIGEQCGLETVLQDNTDLKILAKFEPQQEWLLNPGDMLYLPPLVSHLGVAQTECVTYSVGFRSPGLADMLADLTAQLIHDDSSGHYRDPPLNPTMVGDEIDPQFVAQAKKLLLDVLDNDELIGDWLARFMTEPKYPDLQDITGEKRQASFAGRQYRNGLPLD